VRLLDLLQPARDLLADDDDRRERRAEAGAERARAGGSGRERCGRAPPPRPRAASAGTAVASSGASCPKRPGDRADAEWQPVRAVTDDREALLEPVAVAVDAADHAAEVAGIPGDPDVQGAFVSHLLTAFLEPLVVVLERPELRERQPCLVLGGMP
jgi:hypothetical protein